MNPGEVHWAELDPIRGMEQAGRRPVLVVSAAAYNAISTRAIVCPISRSPRPWVFNLPVPATMRTDGFVLVDQVRALHASTRLIDFVECAPPDFLRAVRQSLGALLEIEGIVDPREA